MHTDALITAEPIASHAASRASQRVESPRVVVAGYGLVTPLGRSAAQTWDGICAGSAIDNHARAVMESRAGEPRVTTLAIAAAREAVAAAGWTRADLPCEATAVIVGTSKGPAEIWLTAPPQDMANYPYVAAGRDDVFGLAGVCDAVACGLGAGSGPRLTLSAACASGLHALGRAWMMIRSREVERAVVVSAESSLHPLFLASFKRLGVLPAEGIGCRPFDQTRDGFLMSEAAAAVCLTAREVAASHPHSVEPCIDAPGEVFVDRFALGGDATHLTGGDPHGRLLRRLIGRVAGDDPIDLVHAHGTGTITNDPVELEAIDETVCGIPNVFSHKAALGHSLGAAGLVSIVLNCLMHERGIIPPNARTARPLRASHVKIARDAVRRDVRSSIAIAAGFGGPTAVVRLVS
ncbi:MAG TPA: beta-ketoacyl synthase N-terminal-like domain-containing protein [Tepidisphaeraceae bacterium]|nr:beta-ketoacyl synthase N-terminal-like domain-containing protein [Tepidisphaeraceae bacterium]